MIGVGEEGSGNDVVQVDPGAQGKAALREGNLDAAFDHLQEALRLQPESVDLLHHLGLVWQRRKKPDEAIKCYEQVLASQADSPDTWLCLGHVKREIGKWDEATAHYREVVRLRPRAPEGHFYLAGVLRHLHQLNEAVHYYRECLKLSPDWVEAHHDLGLTLSALGKTNEAEACYREALQRDPKHASSLNNLGVIQEARGDYQEAAASFTRSLETRPDSAETLSNLGVALAGLGKQDEAAEAYQKALRLNPDFADAHNNLGNVLRDQGKLDLAIHHFEEALRLKPDYAEAYNNLGIVRVQQGNTREALASYDRALSLRPDYPDARRNRGLSLLVSGEFEKGWPEYEFRWNGKSPVPRNFKQPRWDGSNLAGRTILLHWEQGLGDTINFIRYALLVKQLDGRVLFECQRPLARLLKGCLGVDELIVEGSPLPDFDVQAPLLSVPGILRTRIETIPVVVPYLFPEVSALKHWREALKHLKGFRIGIVWQGNPGHKYDRLRSVTLRHFDEVARIPGVRLISLQKGPGTEQLDADDLPFKVTELGRYVMDFTDTAAIVKQLDLVITCDTSVAHLAGALNVPVWVALPFAPDWRWLREREDSPWYPSMRLFRQKERGQWDEVFARINAELAEYVSTAGTPRQGVTRAFVNRVPGPEAPRHPDLGTQLKPGGVEIHNQVAEALVRQERFRAMEDRTSYDIVPYESFPYPNTQPDRLATIATLLDVKPPSPRRCRVLELGCASGGNLIPLAVNAPESTFLGIDLSRVEIAEGQETIKALGLGNIELRHLDLMDVSAELGKFDYIICHGVYSWVPERVQDKILEIVSKHLTPSGVAFISYNTYPGWHMRTMIRDLMLYHAEAYSEPLTKVKQARNLLDFLTQAVGHEKTPYGLLVHNEVEAIRGYRDSYLYHEHLEKDNRPCYFFKFAERASAHGLRYLGEAELRVMVPTNYPPEIANVLKVLSHDLIHLEQYMDFLRNRLFRQTLLCHANLTPNYGLRWERLRPLHFRSRARPQDANLNITSTETSKYYAPGGGVLTTSMPLMKAAMAALADAWPVALSLPELIRQARARLQAAGATTVESDAAAEGALGPTLLSVYASGTPQLLEVVHSPPPVVRDVSERPRTTALVRLQANRQKYVTNQFHENVHVNDLERAILRRLDGEHDRLALVAELVNTALEGRLHVEKGGVVIQDRDGLTQEFTELVDRHLPLLALNALLVG